MQLRARLPDRREIVIDTALVAASLSDEGKSFGAWYDGVTPAADLVLYNGHARLGANIHDLMSRGEFRPGHYMIWFANECDTFAYVDRTLLDRRILLNADDPSGTKYMDTVTNVMPSYFVTREATSMTFLRALVEVRDPALGPKTYEQIFAAIDPEQVVVVSGEEDNELAPLPAPPPGLVAPAASKAAAGVEPPTPPPSTEAAPAPSPILEDDLLTLRASGGCTSAPARRPTWDVGALALTALALSCLRRARAAHSGPRRVPG